MRRWPALVVALTILPAWTVSAQSLERIGAGYSEAVAIRAASELTRVTPSRSDTPWPATLKQTSGANSWVTCGREFYACFLSAVGQNDGLPSGRVRSLFLSSRAPTRAIVEVVGTGYSDTVFVAPGASTRVDLPDFVGLERSDYELAVKRAVYVHSNEVLAIYGFTNYFLSSDGFLVYPIESLGNDYVVASERNALNYTISTGIPNPRSEFAIVATQDNTRVTMKLTATSYSGLLKADSTYYLVLNRGDVYQVMARDTGVHIQPDPLHPERDEFYIPWNGGPDCDLTGSLISSDKPIAVFGGHERAAAPSALEYDFNDNATRDHLAEEMVPISIWGKHYVVVSSGQDVNLHRPAGGDMIRVISAFDSSTIRVNGSVAAKLGRGRFYEFMAGAACSIQSDMPVLVAKYMQCTNGAIDSLGDPDLTLVRPVEAFKPNYTLPGAHDGYVFKEAHLIVICDTTAAYTTLRNGHLLKGSNWSRINGTAFQYGIFNSYAGEQRVESPLPCYAEEYAFSNADSYSYAGGGEYPYVDSLFATDLDFKTLNVGAVGDMASPVHASYTPLATDTVLVYGYQWVSGDTNNFLILNGSLPAPMQVKPGQAINVQLRFHPDAQRAFGATLRVWSSAVNPVLIHLRGQGISQLVTVIPDTIDFGRVRLNTQRDSAFTITNVSNIPIRVQSGAANLGDFHLDAIPGGVTYITVDPKVAVHDSVHFRPTSLGKVIQLDPIDLPDFPNDPKPVVVLMGEGVTPHVVSAGHDFSALRVDSLSPPDTASVVNRGSETAIIDTLRIVDSASLANFTISLDTLIRPSKSLPIELGYKKDTIVTFVVQFTPKSLGRDTLIVYIHTTDGVTIYDKFIGVGVEPLVKVAPKVIDFGTIPILATDIPSPRDSFFTVTSSGTLAGHLDSLVYSDHAHFKALLDKPTEVLNETLAVGASFRGTATFLVTEEGDFTDTVFVANDTRYGLYGDSVKSYKPVVILKAKVRTGPIGDTVISFGTITTCDTLYQNVLLHNPYPVEVHIDSIGFGGQSGGFDFSHRQQFNPHINIPPNGDFVLPLQYVFPIDSLNGSQSLILMLFQRSGGSALAIREFDTVYDTINLVRQQRVLTLHAHLPTFISSANDVSAMRLPITVEGRRDSVPELNSFTFTLHFSNDLFVPYELDTTGGLVVPGFPTGYSLQTHWDQSTRTYTIVAEGTALADQTRLKDDLLFALRMQAYLTTDTIVTVTPTFTFKNHPCNYNLRPFTLAIPYADDCGDPTIRAYMRGEEMQFRIGEVWPNPSSVSAGTDVRISYASSKNVLVHAVITDAAGRETGRTAWSSSGGRGEEVVPSSALPRSGIGFIRLDARDQHGYLVASKMVKVAIIP